MHVACRANLCFFDLSILIIWRGIKVVNFSYLTVFTAAYFKYHKFLISDWKPWKKHPVELLLTSEKEKYVKASFFALKKIADIHSVKFPSLVQLVSLLQETGISIRKDKNIRNYEVISSEIVSLISVFIYFCYLHLGFLYCVCAVSNFALQSN
jgi:hypothetical protein